jgi:arylsulfatase A-like enzyme
VLYTQAYAACPVCSPTRAAIMTGKYPARVGITDWIPGGKGRGFKEPTRVIAPEDLHNLPYEEITLAESFQEAGYKTFFAGKWHLGETDEYWPEHHGFDINKGGFSKGSPTHKYYTPHGNPRLSDGPDGEHLTDRLGDETVAFLKANKDEPFFAYLSFYNVHTPLDPHKDYVGHFKEKAAALPKEKKMRPEPLGPQQYYRQDNPTFASMVKAVDVNVGKVLDTLDELGLRENTIVVFTSDNGGHSSTSNWPLRSVKGWCYEGGVRIPMIIRAPGVSKAGKTSSVVTTSTDHYPTLLELAGLPSNPKQHVDGVSLVSTLKGKGIDRDTVYWHYPHFHGSNWSPGAAIRSGKWKLIDFYELDKVELYNMELDPQEQRDLSKVLPEKTKELLKNLHDWQKSVGAKMPVPNPEFKQ